VGSLPSNTTGAPSNQVQQLNDVGAVANQQDDVRKLRAEYVVLQTSVCTMAGTLDGIAKQLSELKNELSNSLCAGDPLSTQVNASDAPVSTVSTVTKPTIRTYSEVLSKDITKAVQTAVAQTLTTQRKDERDNSAVVMYGLQENGSDRSDICTIIHTISCRVRPIKLHRIGHSYNRTLKIELASPADSREVLTCASELRYYDSTKHLRSSQWLNDEQMAKVKTLRMQCKKLNDDAAANGSKTRPFVVLSNVLYERRKDGKLVPHKQSSDKSSSKSSQCMSSSSVTAPPPPVNDPSPLTSVSKNVSGGSQVAPSEQS
jgi:hypothetical protein